MDIITQSNFDEFKSNFNILNCNKEEDAFEDFSNYCIISKYQRSETITKTTLDSIHVGGGNDTGIDGFILIVNGKQVSKTQEVEDLLNANGYLEVKFIVIQSKTSAKFKTEEIGTFLDGVKLIFRRLVNEVTEPPFNDDIASCYNIVEFIYRNASKFPNGKKPELLLYYVTTGTFDPSNTDIKAKFENVITELRSYNILSTKIEWKAIGANELMEYYANAKQHDEVVIKVGQMLTLPDIDKVEQGYLFLLPFSEYRKLIIDEESDNIKSVFNDNIRAYQGENPVNKEIGSTLDSKEFSLFTAMNNGITIIARQIIVTGPRITLVDYQIVNGCQTSHVLYQKRNVTGIDNLFLLVKLIASTDREVRNSIIVGANSQTAVMREQLIALSETQERIESYYNAVKTTERLYYERRSKQYYGDNKVPAYKIVTIPMQIKSMVSMFLGEPHNVNGYYGCIVEKLQQGANKIFSNDYKLDIYYTCGYAYYKMMQLFEMGNLPRPFKSVRYHLLLSFRLIYEKEKGSMPQLNDKRMTTFCLGINDILNDNSACIDKFHNALNLLTNALNRDLVFRNDCQDEKLTEHLFKLAKSPKNISQTLQNSEQQRIACMPQSSEPRIRVLGKIDLSKLDAMTRPRKR